jgi:hypothetical protein
LCAPSDFQELDQESKPEMLRSGLEALVLRVKTLDMGSPKEILSLALEPPKLSGIERAVVNLKEVHIPYMHMHAVTTYSKIDYSQSFISFIKVTLYIFCALGWCSHYFTEPGVRRASLRHL